GVGIQPVRVDGRSRGRSRSRECLQRLRARVGQDLKTQTARASSSDLDRGAHQGLLAVLAAAPEAFLVGTEPELVDLDFARERAALRGNHRPAQLLEDQPRGLTT